MKATCISNNLRGTRQQTTAITNSAWNKGMYTSATVELSCRDRRTCRFCRI